MRHMISLGLTGVALAAFLTSPSFAGNYGYGNNSGYGYDDDHYYEKKRVYKKRYEYKKRNHKKPAHVTKTEVIENSSADLPLLTDNKGMTLYTFDKDVNGVSNCYGDCSDSWPPYFVGKKAKAREGYSIVLRKDGKQQWAYKGKPLYYWLGDRKPGEIEGDGVGGVWHVWRSEEFARTETADSTDADGTVEADQEAAQQSGETAENSDTQQSEATEEGSAQQTEVQEEKPVKQAAVKKEKVTKKPVAKKAAKPDFLTDEKKMTLYIFDKDKTGLSNCNEDCAVSWPPYLVDEKAKAKENFTVVLRKDGARQWAYKGQPLYFWAGDKKPGDKTGDGVGGVWHIISL
ncbi:MAG: COG4315 family predicted lipoprotein [Methyloligellaceae bacterium]